MSKLMLAVAMTLAWITPADAEGPPPASCIPPPAKTAVKVAPGRVVHCGIDLGSRTAKLNVLSMQPGRNTSLRDERLCKRTLGMGALVFDSTTNTARPLPADAISRLVETVREYQQTCARDGGKVVAVSATQWARDATNITDVVARVKAETGVAVNVLSREQEAEYSYSAASLDRPGRIVLDTGSNSFELAWQEKGAPRVSSITVPYGYVRGATNDFEPARDYASGVAAYQARAREMIERDLGQLTPPATLSGLRALVAGGKVGPELIALGEDGSTVPLAVRGLLRDPAGGWVNEARRYDAVLGGQPRRSDPSFGVMTAAPVTAAEVAKYLRGLSPADFQTLKTDPVRSLYGQKALVSPALVDLLLRELGATRLVTVPQEVTTGHVLRKLAK